MDIVIRYQVQKKDGIMAREVICGIYSITNIKNKKIYIGSSIDIYRRWRDHRYRLNNNMHHSNRLNDDWNKYGESSFEFKVIECCLKENLLQREQFYINEHNSANAEFGYNIQPVAGRAFYKGATLDSISKKKFSLSYADCKSLNYYLTTSDIPIREVARILNLNEDTVYKIYSGAQYTHIFDCSQFVKRNIPSGEKHYKTFLSEEDILDIIDMLKQGMTNAEIAMIYNVSDHFVKDIRTHRSWVHLTNGIEFPKPKRKSFGKRKPVAAYDSKMNLVRTYDSVGCAAKDVGVYNGQYISKCANGQRKTAHGYIWKWIQKEELNLAS